MDEYEELQQLYQDLRNAISGSQAALDKLKETNKKLSGSNNTKDSFDDYLKYEI